MSTKLTILLHSRTGLSALIAGLVMGGDGPLKQALPRLKKQVSRPGQFLWFEIDQVKVICFNSGAAGRLVEQAVSTTAALWGGEHIVHHHLAEGLLVSLRFWLYCLVPQHTWLLARELRSAREVRLWM